jgi:adenine phosphoribosyltransferase
MSWNTAPTRWRSILTPSSRAKQVLIVDDLIATGGTAEAAIKLIRSAGGEVVGCSFVIDLPDMGGAKKLEGHGVKVASLVAFEGE